MKKTLKRVTIAASCSPVRKRFHQRRKGNAIKALRARLVPAAERGKFRQRHLPEQVGR